MTAAKAEPDFAYICVHKTLDVTGAQGVWERIAMAPPGSHLVLSLSEIAPFDYTYMGIAILLDNLVRLSGRFSAISIVGVSERVRQVFLALAPQETAGWFRMRPSERTGGRTDACCAPR